MISRGALFTIQYSPSAHRVFLYTFDMRRSLSCYLAFAILQFVHSSCPDGFELAAAGQCNKYYGQVYQYDDLATNTAITKCEELQAQPVIIRDAEQQSYWAGQWREDKPLLLGLVCNPKTSHWEWSDGSTVDYKPASHDQDLNGNCKTGCVWYISDEYGNWAHECVGAAYFDIYCTEQLPKSILSTYGCEEYEEDGVCYQVGATAESWQDAQKICRNIGADLASIHNVQENSFVRRLAVSRGVVNGVFLGATVSGKGNQFGWIDGSAWDYQHFYPGFPVNGLGDCVAMDTTGTSGEWVNTACNSNFSVACVRKPRSQPECRDVKWAEGQIISSPGFPYDASIPCDFMLMVEAGKKVELEVVMLEANSCCDHLIVFENAIGNNVVANLTGEISDTKYTTTSSNIMRVSWQPNGGVNVKCERNDDDFPRCLRALFSSSLLLSQK